MDLCSAHPTSGSCPTSPVASWSRVLSATKFTASTQQRISGAAAPRLWQRAAAGRVASSLWIIRGLLPPPSPHPPPLQATPMAHPGHSAYRSRGPAGTSALQTRARSAAFLVSAPLREAIFPQRMHASEARRPGGARGARLSPRGVAAAPTRPRGRLGVVISLKSRLPAPHPATARPPLT